MKVSEIIEILLTAPPGAVITCGEPTITLWVSSEGEGGFARFDMMFVGVHGSSLRHVQVDKPTRVRMSSVRDHQFSNNN